MKLFEKITLIITLLLTLAACGPAITPTDYGYEVKADKGPYAVIGSSTPILGWEPSEACGYQETYFGPDRAIVCNAPGEYKVFVSLDENGRPGEISTQIVNESGIPLSLPK
jgi:hypothetical protein